MTNHKVDYRSQIAALLVLYAAGVGTAGAAQNDAKPQANDASECVVLLHGLVRTASSMKKIARQLSQSGYRIANIDYPSRTKRIEELAHDAVTDGVDQCNASGTGRINFVTHSLGGILVRYYLVQHELPNLGRVVMLGPPNHGSEVVDAWRNVPGYFLINGPAGNQLGTDETSIVHQLGPVSYPVGIIAGTRSINLILSNWLPNPDDGKVSVESAKLEGMRDFLTIPVAHPFIPSDQRVIRQTVHFLRDGKFDHARGDQERADAADQMRCSETGELSDCKQ